MTWYGAPCRLSLSGTVDESWIDQIEAALRIRDRRIEITINSPGGDADCAVAAFAAIRAHKGYTTARVGAGAKCHSAALLVYSAAHLRIAHVGATFLVHSTAMAPPDRWDAAAHRRAAAGLESLDRVIWDAIALRCRRPVRAIEAAVSEFPMTAMNAQSLGLVNEVEW